MRPKRLLSLKEQQSLIQVHLKIALILSGRFFKNCTMIFIFTSREKIKPLFYKTLFY